MKFGKIFAANHVFEADKGDPTVVLSKAQLKQLLSLLNNQDEGSNSKANAVTKPGLSKVTSSNWIIDSGAMDHITSSSKLLHKNKIVHYRPYSCQDEKR